MVYIKYPDWPMIMFILLIFASCSPSEETIPEEEYIVRDSMVCYSLFAEPLKYPVETASAYAKKDSLLKAARDEYNEDSRDLNNIVWYGRRLAYLSEYPKAMSVYTRGLHLHPNSPEIYRHRGHRYISMRRFEEAENDLLKAAELARGRDVEIEADGIPNKLNKPLSSLQFNIWYHLGLAHFLQGDYRNAALAYDSCMVYSTNDDLLCATTEWYYLTALKLRDTVLASSLLSSISKRMDIIENDGYHKLLLLYSDEMEVDDIMPDLSDEHQYATIGYGVASYLKHMDRKTEADVILDNILDTDAWSSFGYIAAEADKASGRW